MESLSKALLEMSLLSFVVPVSTILETRACFYHIILKMFPLIKGILIVSLLNSPHYREFLESMSEIVL